MKGKRVAKLRPAEGEEADALSNHQRAIAGRCFLQLEFFDEITALGMQMESLRSSCRKNKGKTSGEGSRCGKVRCRAASRKQFLEELEEAGRAALGIFAPGAQVVPR